MIRNGDISASDIKRILHKHWWILALTTVIGVVLGLGAAYVLPKKFTSQTLVLVDSPTVSADLVKPVVSEASNQRLASMKEQILSRSRLQPVIEKFNLYPGDRGKVHIEDLVERLKKGIEVTALEPMPGTQRQLPGFHVSVTFGDPQNAQRICSEVTTMFMEQNAKYIDDRSTQTTDFFAQQADEAKRKLDEQDAQLAEFKKKYMGSLPDQEQTNLSLLAGMNTQLDAITQAMTRTQQDKSLNESLLASQIALFKSTGSSYTSPDTLEQQLSNLQDQLATLESRYTADHPDVIKTRSQIEQLKKRMASAPQQSTTPATAPGSTVEPPSIQQLRAKLRQDELAIADLSKRQTQVQNQINVLQGRIQSSPAVEQQFKELTRSYQSALDFYNDLLKTHAQAEMSRDINRQQGGEQFRVLDPPNLPTSPSFPKKSLFAGGGLGAGLALGLALIYGLAFLDGSMHTERDVEVCMKLPVLTMVPDIIPAARAETNGKAGRPAGLAGAQA
ncbi:MAG TPA: XrtA system polysaccharide chain length determinant [Dongiaceae bacterium]|nr:XrtA system polysaccharide chain length determinant [Dongiaceae bacterium]